MNIFLEIYPKNTDDEENYPRAKSLEFLNRARITSTSALHHLAIKLLVSSFLSFPFLSVDLQSSLLPCLTDFSTSLSSSSFIYKLSSYLPLIVLCIFPYIPSHIIQSIFPSILLQQSHSPYLVKNLSTIVNNERSFPFFAF